MQLCERIPRPSKHSVIGGRPCRRFFTEREEVLMYSTVPPGHATAIAP